MDPKFSALIERLHPAFLRLIECNPVTNGAVPDYAGALKGIYLFTESGRHLYVGRSNRLLARYRNHWMPNKTEREAAFAFKLARHATGMLKATYKKGEGSRKHLAADGDFIAAFTAAKARIKTMEYRWVEETDPTCQCLLEIYTAVVLATPHNDFDNH
jgi:hypothetical protein